MESNHGFTTIDMKAITQELKDAKGTEEGPYEGDIPLEEVEAAVLKKIKNGKGEKFIFDDYIHPTEEQLIAFTEKLGVPEFLLFLQCDESVVKERFCKKNEVEEVPEDELANIKANSASNAAKRQTLCQHFEKFGERCEILF